MDSLITAAARALAAGDPLGALKRIALRDDAPALALRGIAMAQLGDLVRAKALLRSAARAFGPKEAVARARCVVAETRLMMASASSADRLPFSICLVSDVAMVANIASPVAWLRERTMTVAPVAAATSAMPLPMIPEPSTPTFWKPIERHYLAPRFAQMSDSSHGVLDVRGRIA